MITKYCENCRFFRYRIASGEVEIPYCIEFEQDVDPSDELECFAEYRNED